MDFKYKIKKLCTEKNVHFFQNYLAPNIEKFHLVIEIRNSSLNLLVKKMSSNSVISCLDDIEHEAFKILPRNALDYYRSGANQMISLRENRTAFQKSDQYQS